MSKVIDSRKYRNDARKLNKIGLEERFNQHLRLRNDEIDVLFKDEIPRKGLSNIQYRYLQYGIRKQGVFDIETSDFDPTENFIICYDMRIRDILTGKVEHVQDAITKKDIKLAVNKQNFNFDDRLLKTLSWNILQCDQIVGHYSSKFDYPYFRTRCLLTGQDELIPEYGRVVSADTWRYMRNTLKAKRNTLKNFIRLTGGVDEKTFVDLKYWYITHFKDHKLWNKAMGYIIDHCEKDTKMTLLGLKKVELFNPISRVKI
tara:strand:+ start:4937 stop:5713 length:777 start_codon:yes stop_codon:yes gene_type:complete